MGTPTAIPVRAAVFGVLSDPKRTLVDKLFVSRGHVFRMESDSSASSPTRAAPQKD